MAEGRVYRNVCSDLKCAKPEVNTCRFDFSSKALSVAVMFRSVETVNKLIFGTSSRASRSFYVTLSRNTIGSFINPSNCLPVLAVVHLMAPKYLI